MGHIITLEEYFDRKKELTRFAIIRHDVDKNPRNALLMAEMENRFGIRASYYFRTKKNVFSEKYIKKIAVMNHEIGYHYEDYSSAKGNHEQAIQSFRENLEKLRTFYAVRTICMHGSPLSKYDNRELWKKYDYRNYGIIGEPYFDMNFDEVLYLTDTGRTWNTSGGNIRDKVQFNYDYHYRSTLDIIRAIKKNELPDKILLNVHPQRWSNKFFPWGKELVWQNMKNVVKNVVSR